MRKRFVVMAALAAVVCAGWAQTAVAADARPVESVRPAPVPDDQVPADPVPAEGLPVPVPVDDLQPVDPVPVAPGTLRYVVSGVALEDADEDGFVMLAHRLNRPMAAALGAERKVFVSLDQDTTIVNRKGADENVGDIDEGDRVIVAWTAPAGVTAPRLPDAELVVDLGPAVRERARLAVIGGVALRDATRYGFPAAVLRANRVARKVIPSRLVRVRFDRDTKIVVAGKRYGGPADIDRRDRVIVVWRITRPAAYDPPLPTADLVIVLGPARTR